MPEDEVVDYSGAFPDCIAAQAKGRNCIVLRKIDPVEASYRRADGKRASYQIETRHLSRDARPDHDDYACVLYGPDIEYWQAKEMPRLHQLVRKGGDVNLFEHFALF